MEYVDRLNIFGEDVRQTPCIVGQGVPNAETAGAVGEMYMDALTGAMYKCTFVSSGVHTWQELVGEGGAGSVSAVCYFGMPYTSAEKIVPLSDTVGMYLFPVTDGYDAVVLGNGAIDNCTENAERDYDVKKINRLHIENGVTSIGDYFMHKAYKLQHLSFADSTKIVHLGERAFAYTQICGMYDFSGLTDTTIKRAFEACPKLEGLTFSDNVKTIAKKSFQFCLALRNVGGLSKVVSIEEAAFQYCTSLENIDIVPANVVLGNWAFILTPNEAKANGVVLTSAVWRSPQGLLCFAQNEWIGVQIATPIESRAASVRLPIPETDNQKSDLYKSDWKPFLQPHPTSKKFARNVATGGCFFFSLFHVYNIMKPNAPFDTFYDFIMKGIAPKKIKITGAVHNALTGSEVWGALMDWHAENGTGITYAEGTEVSVLDLPLCLDFYNRDYVREGTFFWGMRQVLGWEATELLFNDDVTRGQPIKETILDELANSRPVIMEIVGASSYDDPNGDGVFGDGEGHAMHAVTAIGYDRETDKLLIVDSTWEYPSDIVPMVYWLPFEALITPDKASAVWTFEFKEVTMAEIDEKLAEILQVASFRIESGVVTLEENIAASKSATVTSILPTELSPNAKIIILEATDEVISRIESFTDKTTWYFMTDLKVCLFSPLFADNKNSLGSLKAGGVSTTRATTSPVITIEDGRIKYTTYSIVGGKYRWKAFYWSE